jgi:dienelactone hydrolase
VPSLILALALFVTNQTPPPGQQEAALKAAAVIAALAAEKFADVEAQFNGRMRSTWPTGQLGAGWTTLVKQVGAHKGCSPDPRVERRPGGDAVTTTCQFERATFDVVVGIDSVGKITGLAFRPASAAGTVYTAPAYADAAAYTEEDLTIGSPEWALPGTLLIPAGAGPHPAVILVHGSGPGDRDTTIGPNKPFKDIALGLASRGIAVLRYDKRSRVHGPKMAASPSMTVKDEVIDDVGEAIKALKARSRTDAARIFVLGHSLGGMLIPRIVQAHPSVAGAIVLAGAARPIEDAIVEQARYLATEDGAVSPDEQALIDGMAQTAAAIRALGPADAGSAKRVLGATPAYWLDLRGYDPPGAARNVKIPLLVLQGERDYQVTMEEYTRWTRALAGTATATFRSYPALNHLFIAGTGKSFPAEYMIPSHVAEDVIRDIAAFIKR